jgi:hypothetical protein
MPAVKINLAPPERFEDGHWCESSQRQRGEGDITASYSADCIGMGEPVRQPFRWRGALWVSVGGSGNQRERRIQAYRLVPLSLFDGPTRSYAATVADGEKARNNPHGFYHGMEVTHGGKCYVLCGEPEYFAPEKTEQLDLF